MKREVTPHLVFTTQAGNRTTVANLTVWIGDQTFEFVGEARCHPDDKFDPEVGARLALGRALESAGNRFQRQADGLVRMHEHNGRHSAKARMNRTRKKNKKDNLLDEIIRTLDETKVLVSPESEVGRDRKYHKGLELYKRHKDLLQQIESEGVLREFVGAINQGMTDLIEKVFGIQRDLQTFQEDGEDILNDSPFSNLDRDTERGREFMDCGPECFPAVGHTKEAGCILAPAAPKPVTMEDLSELGRKIAADVRKVVKEFRKALEDK